LEEDAVGEAKAKPARLRAAAEEFTTYLRRNAGQMIEYGERHRAGERISTGFVESAVNQIVSKLPIDALDPARRASGASDQDARAQR